MSILPLAVCKTYAWGPGNQHPVAVVTPYWQTVNIYESAIFYGGASFDHDGYIVGYLWVYCDYGCSHLILHQILPNHHYEVKFDAPVYYRLDLWVTNNEGAESDFPDFGIVHVRYPYVEIEEPSEFITTDIISATLQNAGYGTPVTWSTQTLEHSNSGGGWAIATAQIDPRYADITFDNNDPPAGGRDYPLSYQIRATVTGSGYTYYADMTQDEISQCRQEYIDMSKAYTPNRNEFRHNGGTAHFPWSDYMQDCDYSYGIERAVLDIGIEAMYNYVRTHYSQAGADNMEITSGYRNPLHNASLDPPGAENSRHIYGDAADFGRRDVNNDGHTNATDTAIISAAATATNASYIEDDYSDGHVHVDWR